MEDERKASGAERLDEESGSTDHKPKPHYCVIYTQALKQWGVSEAIRRTLPEGKGEVFYPCREVWWKGANKIVFRPLFPGYVFIRSEADTAQLHDYIRRSRRQILSFVRELKISEDRLAGKNAFDDGTEIIDLTDDEAEFFDLLLSFEFDAELDERLEKAAKEGETYKPAAVYDKNGHVVEDNSPYAGLTDEERVAKAELRRRQRKVPERGVAQMSFGYMEGKKYVIMDGPLRGKEERIKDIDPKEKIAYMKVKVGGRPTKAGLMILGKKLWFPKDRQAPDILSDGTVIDCEGLARAMNSGGIREDGKRRDK